jgi:hypothetical protein
MYTFVMGAISMGFAVSSCFFYKFWRASGDRLFLLFSIAFFLFAALRLALVLTNSPESASSLYLVRLAGFVILVWAIIDKNRETR